MTAETDIDIAAAYLAPIVWGIEWRQCRMLHGPARQRNEPNRCVRLHPETWCACQDTAASSAAGETIK